MNRASVVFFSGDANKGEVSRVEHLLGHCVSNVCGVEDKVYGITPSFLFDIDENKQSPIEGVMAISSGKSHILAVDRRGSIYSWGSGEYGELGHGSRHRGAKEPKRIAHDAHFVSIDCGYNHSCAVDDRGNMYAWGQNFDRQLGLYKKSEKKLESRGIVENVTMVPKFLPFSLLNPVKVVACGSRFTVAVSEMGEVWTWGAGECGQLGTGRCTHRDIPDVCITKEMFDESFVDVACGFGHVLASTESGKLYSWGLNAKGQLGMGDIAARMKPELVEGLSDMTKVYADGHSSAGINSTGELFTWGSGLHYRLMNGDNSTNVLSPALVTRMSGNVIEKFSFAATKSLALVFTKALKLSPPSGPQKTFSNLELYGCGFWASENIVVKFTLITDEETTIPRSCLGKYVRENVIACKPPKLGELGMYSVTLSMNGTDFLPEALELDICQDPICNSMVLPSIFNVRVETEQISDVIVEASQLANHCSTEGVYVKLCDTIDDNKEPLIVKGYIETEEEKEKRLSESDCEPSPNDDPDSGICRVIVKDVDLTKLLENKNYAYSSISAQVSNSTQDFSEACSERCIAHSFNVFDIEPQCCPSEGQREILVHGTCIPPTSLHIEAIVGLSQGVRNGAEEFLEINLPTRTDDEDKICFTIPPADDIFKKNNKKVPSDVDFYSVQIGFRLSDGKPLQDAAFQFNYYREQPISVYPKAIRASGGTKLTISSSYIQFVSDEAQISFIERDNNVEKTVKFSAFSEIEGEDVLTYAIECESPALNLPEDEEDHDGMDNSSGEKVYVCLLLDGISRPVDSFLFEADLFEEVVVYPVESKAPLPVGSSVTATAAGLIDSDICIIRLRSASTGEYIDLEGEIGAELDTLMFVIPEEVRELFPEDNSKSIAFHIDVCIDGSTYDEMEEPGLQIKRS